MTRKSKINRNTIILYSKIHFHIQLSQGLRLSRKEILDLLSRDLRAS